MKKQTRLILVASLLGTAAIPAYAQTGQTAADGMQNCDRLARLADQNRERFREQWLDVADRTVRAGNQEECLPLVRQARRAAETMDRREAANETDTGNDDQANRIVVEQPDPRVTVEQNSPQITYSQPRPQVSVNQGRPEIVVRQQQPTINVQMPRPTITINQPEPEIIVRMPEPQVAVNVPEPDINVSQERPDVAVSQPEPQVSVQMDKPEVNVRDGSDQAQVEIERSQPVVRREGEQQQARVQVERDEPRVRFERAEPKIEFEGSAKPQVEYNRTGEPTVRYEQADGARDGNAASGQDRDRQQAARDTQQRQASADRDTQQRRAAADEGNDRQRSTAADDQTASIGDRGISEDVRNRLRGDEPASGRVMRMSAAELIGREVVNRQGDTLGEVERVVAMNQRPYVVLSHGGFFGLGEREVALPLDRISAVRDDDQLLMRGLSEDDIEDLPRFDSREAQEMRANQQVEIDQS